MRRLAIVAAVLALGVVAWLTFDISSPTLSDPAALRTDSAGEIARPVLRPAPAAMVAGTN